MPQAVQVLLRCDPKLSQKVRYTIDTLLMACGWRPLYVEFAPAAGPWICYTAAAPTTGQQRCLALAHCPEAWSIFAGNADIERIDRRGELPWVLVQSDDALAEPSEDGRDLIANAFYFLSSWSERRGPHARRGRGLYADSVFARLRLPQDIVDQYAERLRRRLHALFEGQGMPVAHGPEWQHGARFALVLSHDIDFIPRGTLDIARQAIKSILRHLVRQRDVRDAGRAALGLARALLRGRDPYGCIPDLLREEQARGLKTSFQAAVARRHVNDVNYSIDDEQVRAYLRAIPQAGFELALHGSYRSTENCAWYVEEVRCLARHFGAPLGSRQHYLSFDYDRLFAAQEEAGIEYDMSLGFPDRIGPRAGFSYPYFPYNLNEDRPYRVLQLSLFLMDVTLSSYMRLKEEAAWEAIDTTLHELRRKGGAVSVVWHPIVFGGARDPGYDRLFWKMAARVREMQGLATDGRTINAFWRSRAKHYPSLSVAAA